LSDTPLEILFGALLVLVILSGFFSSSETAMMSLNRYRLRHLANTGNRGAKRASEMLQRPDKLLGLILIGNNLVNNAAAALAGIIAYNLYGDAAVAIATLILTLVMLIFAEVTPKTIAAYRPEGVAFPATLILKPLMFVLYPAVWLINAISGVLVRLFGINPAKARSDALSADELRTLVGTTSHRIPDKNQGMLLNILDLDNVTVDEIMVPRNEVHGIDLGASDEVITQEILSSNYTRLPVFEDDINNIVGILHLRNSPRLFYNTPFNRNKLKQLLHEPYFIPENTPLHVQLHNFQKAKRRIGVVVDEYGAVMGLVTLEDILEEIVGEFTSDIADSIEDIVPQEDGSYVIDCAATVREINKALGWKLPTTGPRTLNGLLLEVLESIPESNVGLSIGDYHFEITQLGENRILSARATRA
jgi:Mg2+/Co2+ transporter CorB